MAETLYRRLGGAERVAAIIEDSIDRHAVNPLLAPRLRNKDLPRLKELGMQLLCAAMDLSEQELAAAIDDVVAALKAEGIGPAEVSEVTAILCSLKNFDHKEKTLCQKQSAASSS
jgi:hemoglobin